MAKPPPEIPNLGLVDAIVDLTAAVNRVADILEGSAPPNVSIKANRVSIHGATEPLDQGGTMPEEFPTETLPPIVCNPIQANPTDPDNGQIFFDLVFNGTIDDEPVAFAQGGFTSTTADPMVYDEVTKTTTVRIHVKATSPEALGKFEVPCTWKADDPNTPGQTEQIHQLFKDAGEWMPPNTPKANRVTLGGGTEPLA